jgi:hypothetical protein
MRQTCKVCGHRDKFNFHVPDEIWAAVVPPIFRQRAVCLACFDDFACVEGVEYARCPDSLYFNGDQAVFEFEAVLAVTSDSFPPSVSLGTRRRARH